MNDKEAIYESYKRLYEQHQDEEDQLLDQLERNGTVHISAFNDIARQMLIARGDGAALASMSQDDVIGLVGDIFGMELVARGDQVTLPDFDGAPSADADRLDSESTEEWLEEGEDIYWDDDKEDFVVTADLEEGKTYYYFDDISAESFIVRKENGEIHIEVGGPDID